mgnify:CR=1 FL=1
MMDNFTASFYQNFIEDDRWKYITDGLFNTLRITFFAVLIGIFLGFLIAVVRSTYDKTHKLGVLNALCKVYLTVIRGTPVLVQLLIIYFVVFGSIKIDKTLVAVIAFGINSGAYVAEIFRSGIMSIDNGQFEAGRSLGFNYPQTMFYIVMPQAFKNVLPALGNEFIAMLKDSSLVSVIGFEELTRRGQLIIARTYASFEIWMAVAIIYLIMTFAVARFTGYLERRFDTK